MLDPTTIGNATLYCGDCLEAMAGMEPDSVDAIVTDPPAGIAFMGKQWDGDKGGRAQWIAWMETVAAECLRVLKPGGHALVWAIPRTSHWTGMAWENAGWEPRDKIYHCFGSGFPKSLAIDKALDRMAGAEREVVGRGAYCGLHHRGGANNFTDDNWKGANRDGDYSLLTAPATPAAKQWAGWGTALKPAIEEWWLFRKPPIGTIAQNVLRYGTGGLNVDQCRIGSSKDVPASVSKSSQWFAGNRETGVESGHNPNIGRYPANLIHSGEPEVVGLFPVTSSGGSNGTRKSGPYSDNRTWNTSKTPGASVQRGLPPDTGSAARFFQCCPFEAGDYDPLFYTGKATKKDRDAGCEGLEENNPIDFIGSGIDGRGNPYKTQPRRNTHATVKPLSLMRYLVRLVTPPGGLILDPFMGSGSTGKAALLEGFRFVGIDLEPEHVAIAKARLEHIQCRQGLFADAT